MIEFAIPSFPKSRKCGYIAQKKFLRTTFLDWDVPTGKRRIFSLIGENTLDNYTEPPATWDGGIIQVLSNRSPLGEHVYALGVERQPKRGEKVDVIIVKIEYMDAWYEFLESYMPLMVGYIYFSPIPKIP